MSRLKDDYDGDDAYDPQQQEKHGLREPCDGWHSDRHDDPEHADFPGDMNAGDKGAERKKHQKRQSRGGRIQHRLNAGKEDDVHRRQESRPVKHLRPDHANTGVLIVAVQPSRRDADYPHENGEKLPITEERLPRHAGVCDP